MSAMQPKRVRPLCTVGHSTHPADEFVGILRAAEVTRLVDIRTIRRSRTNPQFNAEVLPDTLAAAGIEYTALPGLGGRRGKSKTAGDANAGWRIAAFRNYADYARSAAFLDALEELLATASRQTSAIMCAEAVWWRCHRRIVADYAIVRGVPVVHLFSANKREAATLTPFAVVGADGGVSYPAHDP